MQYRSESHTRTASVQALGLLIFTFIYILKLVQTSSVNLSAHRPNFETCKPTSLEGQMFTKIYGFKTKTSCNLCKAAVFIKREKGS